ASQKSTRSAPSGDGGGSTDTSKCARSSPSSASVFSTSRLRRVRSDRRAFVARGELLERLRLGVERRELGLDLALARDEPRHIRRVLLLERLDLVEARLDDL